MYDEATSVLNGRLPEMRMIDPYSPTARAKASPAPASTDGSTLGRMTRPRTWRRVAPREAAASSVSASSSASTGWTLRTQKGRVTNSSATATPRRVPARSTCSGLSTP